MAPTRQQTRRSTRDSTSCSPSPSRQIPIKSGITPHRSPIRRSPVKELKMQGLTIAQKQAIMDNIQLEVTERARRLRSQYNLQGQNLRMAIELRVNRIPLSYRKLTMAELIRRAEAKNRKACEKDDKPPPVPEKDNPPQKPNHAPASSLLLFTAPIAGSVGAETHSSTHNENLAKLLKARPLAPPPALRRPPQSSVHHNQPRPMIGKRLSSSRSDETGDKENSASAFSDVGNNKKRFRGSPVRDISPKLATSQVLSPTSSNTRVPPSVSTSHGHGHVTAPASPSRPISPVKLGGVGGFSRPVSPLKSAVTPGPTYGARGRTGVIGATAASAARARVTVAGPGRSNAPPHSVNKKATMMSSTASSSTNSTDSSSAAAPKGRGRPATGAKTPTTASFSSTTAAKKTTAAAGRPRRKVSNTSTASTNTSGTSTASGRPPKGTAATTAVVAQKRTGVMGTLKRGVTAATARKQAATGTTGAKGGTSSRITKTAGPATRSLRKRN